APDGPPQASGPAAAFLSISHAGGLVACAVGDAPLGLDLERVQPRKGLDALIAAVSSEAERAAMPALLAASDEPARLDAFFRLWTLKEAWLKRTGGALFQTMLGQSVAVSPAAGASAHAANACTWRHGDAMLALSAGPPATLAGALPDGIRYWHLAAVGQAA
ncbi:4'-phosphopantetheinyl transferase superfamily protein, partial [Cupriavidus sp. 2TAF22]